MTAAAEPPGFSMAHLGHLSQHTFALEARSITLRPPFLIGCIKVSYATLLCLLSHIKLQAIFFASVITLGGVIVLAQTYWRSEINSELCMVTFPLRDSERLDHELQVAFILLR